ncbi:hypothetical protein TNCV_1413971 [Trichonephila clavipes]|nr:hypothetical protein TNCV_1413971 [Trichonephila clavipes]
MQPLEDAGKNGWKIADFSVMMVAVDLVPQQIEFNEKSHFQLYPGDPRGRVWRSPGQRADPAFTIARHTGPRPLSEAPSLLAAGPLWSSLEDIYSTADAISSFNVENVSKPKVLRKLNIESCDYMVQVMEHLDKQRLLKAKYSSLQKTKEVIYRKEKKTKGREEKG